MKKTIAGVVLVTVGVGMGMAMGAGAAHAGFRGFINNTNLNQKSDGFMNGYVAGASDMLMGVAELSPTDASNVYAQCLRRKATCLDRRGETTTELLAWTKYRAMIDSKQYPNDNVVSTMLADACDGESN